MGGNGENVLYDFGGDDFAGPAPGCETVEDHDGVFVGEGGVEVGFASGEDVLVETFVSMVG